MPTSNVILVLGCAAVNGIPCILLKERLDTAYMSWLLNRESILIVSGGQGPDEPVPEAVVMTDYLMKRGVPRENILLEGRSRCTAQNIAFAIRKMQFYGLNLQETRTIIVSNNFHIPRAIMLAKRCGLKDVTGLAAPTPGIMNKIHMYFREPLAWVKSILLDRNPNHGSPRRKEGKKCKGKGGAKKAA